MKIIDASLVKTDITKLCEGLVTGSIPVRTAKFNGEVPERLLEQIANLWALLGSQGSNPCLSAKLSC